MYIVQIRWVAGSDAKRNLLTFDTAFVLWFIDKKRFVLTKSATMEYLGGKHDSWYVKIKGISRL